MQPANLPRATLDTYLHIGRACARRLTDRARPDDPPSRVWVEALSGFHAGFATMPDSSEFVISGTEGADVFLLDDAFQGVAARVRTEGSVVGPLVRIQVEGHGFRLGNQSLVPGQPSDPERLPADLVAPGVALRLTPVEAPSDLPTVQTALPAPLYPGAPARRGVGRIGLAVAAGAAIIAGGWMIDRHLATIPTNALGALTIVTPNDARAAFPTEMPPPPSTSAPAPPDMATRIAETPLADHLTLKTLPDGATRVEGALPPDLMPLWHDVRAANDVASDDPVLSRVTALSDLNSFPAIASVRLGDDPRIIFASGRRASLGDVIEGWTLVEIAAGQLTLERAGERRKLAF